MKLSYRVRQLLIQLAKEGFIIRQEWDAAERPMPSMLRKAGLIELVDHPSQTDFYSGEPLEAYRISEAGEEALAGYNEHIMKGEGGGAWG